MHTRMLVDRFYCENPESELCLSNEFVWAWWHVSLADKGGIELGCYLSDIECMRLCGALESELV